MSNPLYSTLGTSVAAVSPVGEAGFGAQSGCAWRYDTTTGLARRRESGLFGGGDQLAKSAGVRLRVVLLVLVAYRYVLDGGGKRASKTVKTASDQKRFIVLGAHHLATTSTPTFVGCRVDAILRPATNCCFEGY